MFLYQRNGYSTNVIHIFYVTQMWFQASGANEILENIILHLLFHFKSKI